jgi:hypothetical protein
MRIHNNKQRRMTHQSTYSFSDKLHYLKLLSRGISETQQNDINELKNTSLYQDIKSVFDGDGFCCFDLTSLYDVIIRLNEKTTAHSWNICINSDSVIIHCRFNSVFPGIRFIKMNGHYYLKSFNYNMSGKY